MRREGAIRRGVQCLQFQTRVWCLQVQWATVWCLQVRESAVFAATAKEMSACGSCRCKRHAESADHSERQECSGAVGHATFCFQASEPDTRANQVHVVTPPRKGDHKKERERERPLTSVGTEASSCVIARKLTYEPVLFVRALCAGIPRRCAGSPTNRHAYTERDGAGQGGECKPKCGARRAIVALLFLI
jgi:hypothetical protein